MSDLLPDDLPPNVTVTSLNEVAATLATGPTLTVCFDLDGCVVDSRSAITTCINDALADHDLPQLPGESLERYIGPPLTESLTEIVADLLGDPDDVPSLLAAFRRHYKHTSLRLTTRVEGIREAIDALDVWALTGVVTSKPFEAAVPIVDAVGMRKRFAFVEGPAMDELVEPKAVTLARALDRWGRGDAVVMIGDRHHDIDAGHENGAVTVGVTWGIGDRAELETARADHVIDDPAALPDLIRAVRAGLAGEVA